MRVPRMIVTLAIEANENLLTEHNNERYVNDLDIPLFDLPTIATATNDFSIANKIGQGGFGPVFRGLLVNGQEIAVKTLSSSSGQGLTEFLNEVKSIAKLQHRNLAWKMWKGNRAIELIDPNVGDSYIVSEVLRCMHVSLLCVQQHPDDRPTMRSVILMLGSEMELVEPKEPGFISNYISTEVNLQINQKDKSSTNEMTISLVNPR
ncbi:G-type lectin S-receptor serine/threonine-protein kinase [Spatholobus suberectus]|nr:G-type lectin S-receptor serine/threonine-protein kinase [Spatholobus suberectus]